MSSPDVDRFLNVLFYVARFSDEKLKLQIRKKLPEALLPAAPPPSLAQLMPLVARAGVRVRYQIVGLLSDVPKETVAALSKTDRDLIRRSPEILLGTSMADASSLRTAIDRYSGLMEQRGQDPGLFTPGSPAMLQLVAVTGEISQIQRPPPGLTVITYQDLVSAVHAVAAPVSQHGLAQATIRRSFRNLRGLLNPLRWPACIRQVSRIDQLVPSPPALANPPSRIHEVINLTAPISITATTLECDLNLALSPSLPSLHGPGKLTFTLVPGSSSVGLLANDGHIAVKELAANLCRVEIEKTLTFPSPAGWVGILSPTAVQDLLTFWILDAQMGCS